MKFITFYFLLILGIAGCGGSSSSTGDSETTSDTTREFSGAIVQASIPLPSLTGTLYQTATDCADIQVCCNAYDGTTAVATVASDCSFTLSLPLNNFCFCGLFTGEDADGDGCFNDYLGSLGCSENGYSGAIPIFVDADGSTDPIDLGSGEVQGARVVSSVDICSQVDQDSDGTRDSEDSDDDGDDVADGSDNFNSVGCESVAELDSDGNNVPDIFEDLWDALFGGSTDDFFMDDDADDIPDGCDEEINGIEFSCIANQYDTDGDCIDDEFDDSLKDMDEDGLIAYIDCDDDDALVGFECYEEEFCALDIDEDGVEYCDDCDDFNGNETRTFAECTSGPAVCEANSTACGTDFDCQLFADVYFDDEFETDNVVCFDGCCVVAN